jgi:hypothetical protein
MASAFQAWHLMMWKMITVAAGQALTTVGFVSICAYATPAGRHHRITLRIRMTTTRSRLTASACLGLDMGDTGGRDPDRFRRHSGSGSFTNDAQG